MGIDVFWQVHVATEHFRAESRKWLRRGKLPVPETEKEWLLFSLNQRLRAYGLGRPRLGRLLGQRVRSYGASILAFGPAEVTYAEDLVASWVTAAENILYPKARRRPLGQPCPACGSLWVLGENGRVPAVTISADLHTSTDVWEAHCAACDADWVGEQIGYLLKAVAS